jgi:nucleotide-binding universal stress UspA family protein
MTEDTPHPRAPRILIALDASSGSLAALEAAAFLAARLDAELLGLFVEDEELLALAALPFAAEVEVHSAVSRPLTSAGMEQRLRAQASRAAEALARAAGRHRLRWEFRVVRGAVTREVLAAVGDADFVALGGIGSRAARSGRLGETALEMILRGERPVLLLAPGGTLCEPIAVVYRDDAAAGQALDIAARLARRDGGSVRVFLVADDAGAAAGLEAEARGRLAAFGVEGQFQALPSGNAAALPQALRRERIGTAVLTGASGAFGSELARMLAEAQICAVILVR